MSPESNLSPMWTQAPPSRAALLDARRVYSRDVMVFLGALVGSMALNLCLFDRLFQWSHHDNLRVIGLPLMAYLYAIFMLIWLDRILVTTSIVLEIDDQLEVLDPTHKRILSRFKADDADPPIEYLLMFMFNFLLVSSSMVAWYIAFNAKRMRDFVTGLGWANQGHRLQALAVLVVVLLAVPIFFWGWNQVRKFAWVRYRNRPLEPEGSDEEPGFSWLLPWSKRRRT